jgi:AraC family transcriptional regulator of adaptative response/methylated-DNA-[protein]-cysteine methyltransferase
MMTIEYTIVPSPLGSLLVAATGRGVCAVSFGSSASGLATALARHYPGAAIRRDVAALQPWADAILRHLDGDQPRLDLPLDAPGTPLETGVWDALRTIPYGTTRSYGAIARDLDLGLEPAPTAQEVGQACASNRVALVIPCHRVVRADGSLGGYRWGVARKRHLLAGEGALSVAEPAGAIATAAARQPGWHNLSLDSAVPAGDSHRKRG